MTLRRAMLGAELAQGCSAASAHRVSMVAHRDKMGSDSSTFSAKVREESYRPPMGFAAAMTEHLACSCVTMPALLMEMLCCSIACVAPSTGHDHMVAMGGELRRLPVRYRHNPLQHAPSHFAHGT